MLPLNAPGDEILGYVLEVMDTSSVKGVFTVIFDGSMGYPNTNRVIMKQGVRAGQSYIFRVKAAY